MSKTPRLPAGYQGMTQDEFRRWMDAKHVQGLVRARMWTKWINNNAAVSKRIAALR